MAINPNNGVLDIINGTLKVSSIDIKQTAGFTTAINTVARNDVLLADDQKSTTTFTPTALNGYMSSTGVTRDTSSNYLELGTASDGGWVYWPLQLPNSWHTEFDMHVTATGGVLTYSLFNTTEPNHTDYTNNDGGYKIVFDNTNNQIDIYWEGSIHKTVSATLRSNDWQHVNINYFQGAVSISLAGKVVLTHEFTENYQEFESRYVGFSATAGTSHKIRHLIVHNSDKWLYTKTSNASDIAYVSGNVGIGSLTPTELLDVHGNVHIAKDLTVDGNLTVSGTTTFIDSTNLAVEDPILELARGNTSDTIDAGLIVTRNTSNVAVAYRGDEEELALGYTQSGASDTDVTPIADGGLDVRVYGNLFANNLTTTANVEATYVKGDGSELTQITLDQVVGYANTTGNTVQLTNTDVGLVATGNVEANYFVGDGSKLTGLVTTLEDVANNGNTMSNTIQFTNATTAFVADSNVGIGTDAPTANLHVVGYQYVNDPPTIANSFDHSDAPLTLTHGTVTSADPKPILHLTREGTSGQAYGARASFNLSRYENSGTASRSRLDLALADGTYAESTVMTLRADGNVGVGTTSPAYKLDVHGSANVGALTATTISGPLSGNASTATQVNNSLTPGSYLTGSAFNGSAAQTFAVDATTTNTANKIVARDASGHINFTYGFSSYLNMSHGVSGATGDTIFYSSYDNYIRKNNATGFRASLNVPTRTGGDASGTWGISISGNAATATTAGACSGSAAQLGGVSLNNIFNNTGGAHSNRTDFDAVPDAGCYYITGTTNGPGVNGANQYYGFTLGLGSNYAPVNDGATGRYGSQIYWGRNVSSPYINIRFLENGTWQSWQKAAAGYADSAGSAGSCTGNSATATTATNQSGGTVSATTGSFSSAIYYNEWIRNNRTSASGLYWHNSSNPGYAWHIYPESRQDMTLRTGSSNGGIKGTVENTTARGYIHWTTSNEIGFLNSSREWSLRCDNSKNVQIYGSVTANSAVYASNWLRTYGNTGWYSETHGGGWYMTDSSWVRAYNSKSVYTAGEFFTDGNKSVIRGGSPTLYFRDTNQYSAMLHNNDARLYVLRGGTDTETWTQVNGQWPWIFNLTNNDSTCGGNLYINGGNMIFGDGRGIRTVSGEYGTVQTTGAGVSGWTGYSIDGKYVFMSDGGNYSGLYNDLDNEWHILNYRNAWVQLYYNNQVKLQTTNGGATVTGVMTADNFSSSAGTYFFGIYSGNDSSFDYYDTFISKSCLRNSATNFTVMSDGSNQGFSAIDLQFRNIMFYAYGASGTTNFTATNINQYHKMIIKSSGAVGINDTTPSYRLDVNGNFRAYGIYNSSDRRIKKDIVDVDDASALDILRLLKPKKYKYIDEKKMGTNELVWGFIAQEVREVLPYSTDIISNFIPNINELTTVTDSNVITLSMNTSNLISGSTELRIKTKVDSEIALTISEIIDEHSIRVNEDLSDLTYSLDENGNIVMETVTEVITVSEYLELEGEDARSEWTSNILGYTHTTSNAVITVDQYETLSSNTSDYTELIDKYTKTYETYTGNEIFVLGQVVDDYHTLKKDAIWTVSTAALQEVDRQLQAEKAKVATLETQLASVLARLDALENPPS